MKFTDEYREEPLLRDGTQVVLRPIQPSDKRKLVEGLQHLSPESRYRRFFSLKARFTPDELKYLTELDGYDHFAIAALYRNSDGTEGEGAGVARFVRLRDEPGVAEPAVAVIDKMQGKGLGSLLMMRLGAAARERGIDRFRCDILAENAQMRTMIQDLFPQADFQRKGRLLTAEFALPEIAAELSLDEAPREWSLLRLLEHVASGSLVVQRTFDIITHPFHWREEFQALRSRERGDSEAH